jgi:HKD family nuclease
MTIRFIGQGYNMNEENSVASELIKAFNNPNFDRFSCLVAFASRSGISALTPHVNTSKNHIDTFRVIVGIDQNGTSQEALEEILSWNIEGFVYYTPQRIIFHPKVYLFQGETENLIVIGSSNLTQMGLAQNVEASVAIQFTHGDESGNEILNQIRIYYGPMFDGTEPNLQSLTEELIARLVRSGLVPNEAKRRKLYAKDTEEAEVANQVREEGEEGDDIGDLFGSTKVQTLPEGFKPIQVASPQRYRSVQTAVVVSVQSTATNTINAGQANQQAAQATSINLNNGWTLNANDEVLVAELSGPERWAQANFDIASFTNFFGATAGNNNYHISLVHIDENGNQGPIVQSQAVSVQSSNYRFELSAAAGKAYPTGNRPICAFIKVATDRFVYNLAMPNEAHYNELRDFLDQQWNGPTQRRRRVRTNMQSLQTACPNLPFWGL